MRPTHRGTSMKRIVGWVFILLTAAAFFLMVFQLIDPLVFWIIMALAAVVAYFVLPRIGRFTYNG